MKLSTLADKNQLMERTELQPSDSTGAVNVAAWGGVRNDQSEPPVTEGEKSDLTRKHTFDLSPIMLRM